MDLKTLDTWLTQINDTPEDDTLRLVFSDWLQEQGKDRHAEYLRTWSPKLDSVDPGNEAIMHQGRVVFVTHLVPSTLIDLWVRYVSIHAGVSLDWLYNKNDIPGRRNWAQVKCHKYASRESDHAVHKSMKFMTRFLVHHWLLEAEKLARSTGTLELMYGNVGFCSSYSDAPLVAGLTLTSLGEWVPSRGRWEPRSETLEEGYGYDGEGD